MESTVLLAALGIVATCVGVLVWLIKFMFERIIPAIDGFKEITDATLRATIANTEATKSADTYLRERNGRDNIFHKEVMDELREIKKNHSRQTVGEQHVEHQIIHSQE